MRELLVVVILLFSSISTNASDSEVDPAETLLDVSNVKYVLESITRQFKFEIVLERITAPDDALSDDEQTLYLESLTYDYFSKGLLSIFQKSLTREETEWLIRYFQQPLMKRYLSAERFSETADGAKTNYQILRKTMTDPPSIERIRLVNELEAVELSTERQLFILETLMRERNKARLEYHNQYSAEEAQRLDYQMSQYKMSIEKNVRSQRRIIFYQLLADFDDKDIKTLIDQVQQDRVRQFMFIYTDGLVRLLGNGINHGIKKVLGYRDKQKV